MNRLQQLADIRNKIYQVTEKLSTEIDLNLEATKVDTQAIYALSKISDAYAKLVMTEEKLEHEIAKREALKEEKLAEETTPPEEEISATDRLILDLFKNSPRFRNLKEDWGAEKLYNPDTIIPSEANYNCPRECVSEKFELREEPSSFEKISSPPPYIQK